MTITLMHGKHHSEKPDVRNAKPLFYLIFEAANNEWVGLQV